jgi:hypothetical protein
MKAEETIRKLAARARLEVPATVDVADRVIAILRARTAVKARGVRAFAWVAGVSAVLAVPLAAAAMALWHTWTDPLVSIFFQSPWGTP